MLPLSNDGADVDPDAARDQNVSTFRGGMLVQLRLVGPCRKSMFDHIVFSNLRLRLSPSPPQSAHPSARIQVPRIRGPSQGLLPYLHPSDRRRMCLISRRMTLEDDTGRAGYAAHSLTHSLTGHDGREMRHESEGSSLGWFFSLSPFFFFFLVTGGFYDSSDVTSRGRATCQTHVRRQDALPSCPVLFFSLSYLSLRMNA